MYIGLQKRCANFWIYFTISKFLIVNECINLEMAIIGGNKKLETATSTARKDRYSSLAYGNFFASLLDQDLLQEQDTGDDWTAVMGLTYGF